MTNNKQATKSQKMTRVVPSLNANDYIQYAFSLHIQT